VGHPRSGFNCSKPNAYYNLKKSILSPLTTLSLLLHAAHPSSSLPPFSSSSSLFKQLPLPLWFLQREIAPEEVRWEAESSPEESTAEIGETPKHLWRSGLFSGDRRNSPPFFFPYPPFSSSSSFHSKQTTHAQADFAAN
jgi:hypothetical protein